MLAHGRQRLATSESAPWGQPGNAGPLSRTIAQAASPTWIDLSRRSGAQTLSHQGGRQCRLRPQPSLSLPGQRPSAPSCLLWDRHGQSPCRTAEMLIQDSGFVDGLQNLTSDQWQDGQASRYLLEWDSSIRQAIYRGGWRLHPDQRSARICRIHARVP